MKRLLTISACLCLINLTGCYSQNHRPNKPVNTAIGATAGGLTGVGIAQGAGTTVLVSTTTILGGLIGYSLGTPMEKGDKEKAYAALASGTPTSWQNNKANATYTITPARNTVTLNGNDHCRAFIATQTLDSNTLKIQRTACQEANGAWELVR